MKFNNFDYLGLTRNEIAQSRAKHGENRMDNGPQFSLLSILTDVLKDPMVILLLLASCLYFVTGHVGDGLFLTAAIFLIGAISIYQDSRSKKALDQLKKLSQPESHVIREGRLLKIKSAAIVVDDILVVEEGSMINADAIILQASDFSVDESILTGESLAVYKNTAVDEHLDPAKAPQIFSGTTVSSGMAVARVTAIGNQSVLGKIGKKLTDIVQDKSPLEIQIAAFVKNMVFLGLIVFGLVWVINFYNSRDFLDSLLKALTLAMSILPEEIPVAFSTFMAMGAWRMSKLGVIVKRVKTVETLGSATVICVDKTGTITTNEMTIAALYDWESRRVVNLNEDVAPSVEQLLKMSFFASESIPFDPMEKAIHESYTQRFQGGKDLQNQFKLIREYPLRGKPPMMTHALQDANGQRIIACKGAPEAVIEVSNLSAIEKKEIVQSLHELAKMGYRLLGVAEAEHQGDELPESQRDFDFRFLGILAFNDPPKSNIEHVFKQFDTAGIDIKIITGDNAVTTSAIAQKINFEGADKVISGAELVHMTDEELMQKIEELKIFTRMFPEAKLRIIDLLKKKNEVVAMTGDGVNDSLALKAAHIGVAMGKRGTEIAKASADLVLVEDDLSKMVEAVAMGRKIYTNLKKAIRYIISIHTPIILIVFFPLALGWVYPNIFTPVHVILLELIMGPTCSIIYENEPMEKDTMVRAPRSSSETMFSGKELLSSIVQGVAIAIGALVIYQYAVSQGASEAMTRTLVFMTLVSANIFLTLVNRSFYYSILTTLQYRNPLVPVIVLVTMLIMAASLTIKPINEFFKFEQLPFSFLLVSVFAGFISVIWYELVKWQKRIASRRKVKVQAIGA